MISDFDKSDFYSLSVIKNRYATELKAYVCGLPESRFINLLAARCANPKVYAKKEDVPLFNANRPADRNPDCRTRSRKADDFDYQTALIVDYDSGAKLPDVAGYIQTELKADCLIYASFNNGKDGVEKFRAVVPVNWPFEVRMLACPAVREKLLTFFPGCDHSTFDRGRFFNVPVRRPQNENSYTWHDGRSTECDRPFNINSLNLSYIYQRWEDELKLAAEREKESASSGKDITEQAPVFAARKLEQFGYADGNHDTPLYKTACAMKVKGYSENDAVMALSSYSTQGHSFANICSMVQRVYNSFN